MSEILRDARVALLLTQIRGELTRMSDRFDELEQLVEDDKRERMVSAMKHLRRLSITERA